MRALDLKLSFLDRIFTLQVVNVSPTPVRIWTDSCSFGYESLRFRACTGDGTPWWVRRKPARWTVNIPDYIEILPAAAHIRELDLGDGSWDLSESQEFLRTELNVSAILEIGPDANTALYGVVTGSFESNSLHFASVAEAIRRN
jgi:hypothetical protein